AEYSGGDVVRGHLVGTRDGDRLDFRYVQLKRLAGVQPVFSEVSLRAIHGRPGREVVGHLRLYTARALREFVAASGFEVVRLAGAPFHGVPRPLRALDRLACARPSLSSILLLHARRT
ncbi:hypothetical protein ACWDRX_36190, partial [Streptomyces nigra]